MSQDSANEEMKDYECDEEDCIELVDIVDSIEVINISSDKENEEDPSEGSSSVNGGENEKTWSTLKLKCTSKLRIQKQEFFEFSEQSVLSNLYWGIDSIEAAIQAQKPEEKSFRLMNSEQMLQVPAMLDEKEVTVTISNRYLVCCSYFYLSMVRNLQGDEWQAALHFLQAALVYPELVRTEFASELCRSLFDNGSESLEHVSAMTSEDDIDDAIMVMARRYRECLVYYQVMLYGEAPWWRSYCTKQSANGIQVYETLQVNANSNFHAQENRDDREFHEITRMTKSDDQVDETFDWKLNQCTGSPQTPQYSMQEQMDNGKLVNFGSSRFTMSIEDVTLSISNRDKTRYPHFNCHVEDALIEEALKPLKFHLLDHVTFSSASEDSLNHKNHEESSETELQSLGNFNEVSSHSRRYSMQQLSGSGLIERKISDLLYSKALGKSGEKHTVDIASIYESLTSSSGNTYASLKDVLLDELLIVISTSKDKREIRESVSTLTTIISRNKSVIEDIKKKGLRLCDLASALKQNVHEAAILIYLINPSPIDIKTLELLPILIDIVCTSQSHKSKQESLLMTPHAASLMIIEELVTSFDYVTNNMHLAAISSPQVLGGLLEVARNDNLEDFFSLTTILIKCMQFDAQCRKYVSQFTPLAPFIHLLHAENTRAKCIALEFFHEILCIPRPSAITLLQRIQQEGGINVMQLLMLCAHQLQPDHQLLAANILLQLDSLKSPHKSLFREEAVQILLRALGSEESSEQILSAYILSNLSGTYDWTGEPYKAAWLLRKTGLTSPCHQNMIRNFNWLDKSLQVSFGKGLRVIKFKSYA
ncbi:unnamed protein product [Lupinus luteus]|uniref:Uncharacterized protein n=1 Tax=Lupinus luteus TaxID=3873 RepID=A0AAV1VXB3_LUPLU